MSLVYIQIPNGFIATIDMSDASRGVNALRLVLKEQVGLNLPDTSKNNRLLDTIIREAEKTRDQREAAERRYPRQARTTPTEHVRLTLQPVKVGDCYGELINQAVRDCEVIEVKRTRYRIVFEMPNCEQKGWRSGVLFNKALHTLNYRRA